MLKIETVATKQYQIDSRNINTILRKPCTIDWGDGTSSVITQLNQFKHTYKKEKPHTILVKDLDTSVMTFRGDTQIVSIDGELPVLDEGSLIGFFQGAINLRHVGDDIFINNSHQKNISALCQGVPYLESLKFITRLTSAEDISYILDNCKYLVSIDELAGWGENVIDARRAFSGSELLVSPRRDILAAMGKLKIADGIFMENPSMSVAYTYFSENGELESIRGAFYGCSNIKPIDKNWLYYLPMMVTTDRTEIFNKSVRLNGI